jgi:hypothetical protein
VRCQSAGGRSPPLLPAATRRQNMNLSKVTNAIIDIRIITIITDAKTAFDIKSEQVTFDRIDRGFKGEYLLA